jgi:hypothetical protein
MKIYLDDERETPLGYRRCYWPEEVIELLKTGKVTHISLDHDLGEDSSYAKPSTGYDVILWLEEQVMLGKWEHKFPIVIIQSANPVAKKKMGDVLQQIYGSMMILE